MTEILKLLVINPHPDDESFFFGETICKYGTLGIEIHVLNLTNGEKGKLGSEIVSQEKEKILGDLRKKESGKALNILGVENQNIYFADIPNLNVDQKAIDKIAEIINKVDPQVVISFNEAGTSRFTNQDHSWSAIATYFAILKLNNLKNMSFQRYLTFTVPNIENYFDEYNEIKIEPEKLTTINIKPFIQNKKEACEQHNTQSYINDYFARIGFLDIPTESYLERINSCALSSQGTNDIFFDVQFGTPQKVDDPDKCITNPMPLNRNQYLSSTGEIFSEITRGCTSAILELLKN